MLLAELHVPVEPLGELSDQAGLLVLLYLIGSTFTCGWAKLQAVQTLVR